MKKYKNEKNKKLEENCNFSFFGFFLAPLETKMMKIDLKKWKKEKHTKNNEKNWRKIAIFYFLEFLFAPLEAKMKKIWKWKNDSKKLEKK